MAEKVVEFEYLDKANHNITHEF